MKKSIKSIKSTKQSCDVSFISFDEASQKPDQTVIHLMFELGTSHESMHKLAIEFASEHTMDETSIFVSYYGDKIISMDEYAFQGSAMWAPREFDDTMSFNTTL